MSLGTTKDCVIDGAILSRGQLHSAPASKLKSCGSPTDFCFRVSLSGVSTLLHLKKQSLARHTHFQSLCSCVTTLHCSMHSCTLRRIFFVRHSSFVVLRRKWCHRHIDDRIHMHFHDNPTDTQHHSAHTHEVSLGSAAPLRNPSDTARTRWAIRPSYLLPGNTASTCTTRTKHLQPSRLHLQRRGAKFRNQFPDRRRRTDTPSRKLTLEFLTVGASQNDTPRRNEGCLPTKVPTFLRGAEDWQERSECKSRQVCEAFHHQERHFEEATASRRWEFERTLQTETARVTTQTTNELIFTSFRSNQREYSKRNAKS